MNRGLLLYSLFWIVAWALPGHALAPFTSIENRVRELNQTVSYLDGANCFNATLLGLGYLDQRFYTDSAEFEWILQTYCDRRDSGAHAQAGDVAVFRRIAPIHAALVLGDDLIFEKVSVAGKSSQFIVRTSPSEYTYMEKKPEDSPYFNGTSTALIYPRGPEAELQYYACAPAEQVRADWSRKLGTSEGRALIQLSLLMNNLSILNAPALPPSAIHRINRMVAHFTRALPETPVADEASALLLVRAHSVLGALRSLEPYSAQFDLKDLNLKLRALFLVHKDRPRDQRLLPMSFFYNNRFIY